MAQATFKQFEAGSEIRYPCLGYELGFVHAKWDADTEAWMHRHETDVEFRFERMTRERARFIFPTDAELVEG